MRGTAEGEWSSSLGLAIGYRPSPQVDLEVEPSLERQRDPRQYVATVNDPSFTPTFGQRFLFADIERTAFSVATRLNVTFTPHLTLQLFAQPLLSAGEFVTYKQFSQGRDRPVRALRGGYGGSRRHVGIAASAAAPAAPAIPGSSTSRAMTA
jgi:hypothetical protein